jgi:putative transposase
MAAPPRLSEILLPQEKAITYFVTLCVTERSDVLATDHKFDSIKAVTAQISRWNVLAGVVVPDHIHFVVTPAEDRGLSISDFSTAFKRLLRKALSEQGWQRQRGCFDRVLRSDENFHNKWLYMAQNPVRAGLVSKVEDWPYYFGSIPEQQSVGEAVGLPIFNTGTLTASPTEEGREEWEASSFPYRGN